MRNMSTKATSGEVIPTYLVDGESIRNNKKN